MKPPTPKTDQVIFRCLLLGFLSVLPRLPRFWELGCGQSWDKPPSSPHRSYRTPKTQRKGWGSPSREPAGPRDSASGAREQNERPWRKRSL